MAANKLPSQGLPADRPQASSKPPTAVQYVRQHHPELAMAMRVAKRQSEAWVTLDTLPLATKQWLWTGIQRVFPELATDMTEGPLAELKSAFSGSTLALMLDDIVHIIEEQIPPGTGGE